MGEISIKNLKALLPNINLIDIRSIENYNRNHIPGAKNIPYEILLLRPEKYLDKSQTYYLYCQKGMTTIKIAMILRSKGYKIVNVQGGYEAWLLDL